MLIDVRRCDSNQMKSLAKVGEHKSVEEHSELRRSCTGKSSGVFRRENAGMSSERKVRILPAEYLRFPE